MSAPASAPARGAAEALAGGKASPRPPRRSRPRRPGGPGLIRAVDAGKGRVEDANGPPVSRPGQSLIRVP